MPGKAQPCMVGATLAVNAGVKMPPQFGTFKQAQRVQQSDAQQAELGFG